MAEKSFVTLEQHQCPICCEVFETGSLLMDTRMRETFEQHTLTGHSHCAECKDKIAKGYVALIVADPTSPIVNKGTDQSVLSWKDAKRTGQLVWCRRSVIPELFGREQPEDQDAGFIPVSLYDKLVALSEQIETQQAGHRLDN